MGLTIRIDQDATAPPYDQLYSQLAAAISHGQLAEGTKLPTVRQLASDLSIAPGTVMKAYAALADAGLIISKRARGSVVAPGASKTTIGDDLLDNLVADFVTQARALGASDAEIRRRTEDALS